MSTSIKITNYRAYDRGKALKGFFTVTLESGLIIHGVKLFVKDGGYRWIGMPSEKFNDRNTGAEGFRPIVEFASREASDRFRDAVLSAVDAQVKAPPTPKAPDDDSDITF